MKLNNKGFAITGILYTVFILFLLIIASVLGSLQFRKNMLEKATMKLEETYEGTVSEALIEKVEEINTTIANPGETKAPVTGKYIFTIQTNFFADENSENINIFKYTGTDQEFTAHTSGYYRLEVWGADGGDATKINPSNNQEETTNGGKGGYSSGLIKLDSGDKLYVVVGGSGTYNNPCTGPQPGGYNGGGSGNDINNNCIYGASGGGATHIAFDTGELKSFSDINKQDKVLIVAGGGGGANIRQEGYGIGDGGNGGGTTGDDGNSTNHTNDYSYGVGTGGTHDEGGYYISYDTNGTPTNNYGQYQGSFGQGKDNQSGGGGGWYGGGASAHGGAGGGSGHINEEKIKNGIMLTGSSAIPQKENEKTGYARITYLGTGEQQITDVTCSTYLTRGTPIDSNITFLTDDCNEAMKYNKSRFIFENKQDNLEGEDFNILILASIYSFER